MAVVEGKAFVYTQPLYDTIELAAAAVQGSFFTVPYGGLLAAGVNKTFRETNLIQAGRLEAGNEMRVEGCSIHFGTIDDAGALPTLADIQAIHAGNIRWLMGGSTEVLKVPVALIPSAGADLVVQSDAAAAPILNVGRGVSAHSNMFPLHEPYVIRAQESVEVVIENMDAIAAATRLTFVFWGTMVRPVR